ncbi:serine carboxypeptidase s28 domain-containing protein [Ditylenchus destructor]|nr:serine carboxypeptidase s28 domain-containing protein [Ditylenchus destructor]
MPGDTLNGPPEYYSKCNNDVTIKNLDRWYWQKCTEFGYFKTTPIDGGIFDDATLPLRGFIKEVCVDKFPEANFNQSTIQAATDKTNSFYGGNKNFNATNVVFVNGSEDPWHVLSVYDTPNDSVKSILVQGTSHGADYGAEQESDPRALKNARQRVKHEIDHWLGLKE